MKNKKPRFKEADAALFVLHHPSFYPVYATSCSFRRALKQPNKGRKRIIENVNLINYHSESWRSSLRREMNGSFCAVLELSAQKAQ